MKHTDDTHCSWADRPGACRRTHVPGMGKDHYMGTQRPAADPEGWVMQGHADYCAEYGHAEGGGYGIAGLCARCGEQLPATPVADLQVGDPAHTDDLRLGCAAVTLALLLNLGTITTPGYPYWLRITTHTYGELVSQPDIWEHESAGTMVGGYWGPYRIFANVPLSAIDAYLVRKEN